MNSEQFFKAFEKRAQNFKFKLIGGWIREGRSGKCPICAVACAIFKKSSMEDYQTDGKKLGLKEEFSESIMLAADNVPSPTRTQKKYRNKLLKLAGLKEKE